jgi:hypothetical protein
MKPRSVSLTLVGLFAATICTAAQTPDLREFSVGMSTDEFPLSGYREIVCVDTPTLRSDHWDVWRECPTRGAGERMISMSFETPEDPRVAIRPSARGTRVGGLPVEPQLLIDQSGRLIEIRLSTKTDGAPAFAAKRANMLALVAKSRFGEDGWTCRRDPPDADRRPIGDVFVDEHCEKKTDARRIVIERRLYRQGGAGGKLISEADVRVGLASN